MAWSATDFYLGTHRPNWLPLTDVPLFVSDVTLRRSRRCPKAKGRRAEDSGGFSMLSTLGYWPESDLIYAGRVSARADQAGSLPDFAACRDWMCEPLIRAKTRKTVRDHQMLTIESYVNLVAIAPWIQWLPVVQGWHVEDYQAHVEMYRDAGVDLTKLERVGVGSVCRRQATKEGADIITAVADMGIRVHAFGVKVDGLKLFGDKIASADSMAWSFVARRRGLLLDCCRGGTHKNCANCFRWAHEWHRTRICKLPPTQGFTTSENRQRRELAQMEMFS